MLTDKNKFISKIAVSKDEIYQALQLRYRIFSKKNIFPLSAESHNEKLDMDFLDKYCQHIIVIDSSNGIVIGTARFLEKTNALQNNKFLTDDGFDTRMLRQINNEFIEIGRVCVDRNYQSENIFILIKKEFNKFIQNQYLGKRVLVIGMYSLEYSNDQEVSGICHYLNENSKFSEFHLNASINRRYNILPKLQSTSITSAKQLPKLLRVYLSLGAKLLGIPAEERINYKISSISLPIVTNYHG